MTILYTAKNGTYTNLNDILKEEKNIKHNVYVNLTNKCSCACTFCLRNTKEMDKSNSLWLDREPTSDEVIFEFEKYDLNNFNEIIFCGFGEPTMALDTLLKIATYLKNKNSNLTIRINTNGLCDLVYKKEIAPLFKGLIDTISISLNASNAKDYLNLTRNNFGLESFDAMLKFAVNCKTYIPNVVMTVVDCIGQEEINACQAICDKIGVTLRVRPFE
ncbi:TIGR04100 family radical SAM protein [Clostridium saccharobutylicum]|uniref:Radical SAM-superfamily protein n=1 Tax=Clostridium saccharobutylicum DSM 13864 TaxID=1345695 RepID=U5MTD1_CLOSA|nr:TIGR04100 family radical SAM protein [Clostridium saccharobutylicum]AGX43855.1 radical SAM-superfamily protein [Clostridium saccharobutylicum DSM 13864]AQR91154.1 7-carboxy-7-deazaguanine synthase [Clostridium saccharobutylicum]AQS01058.1 7-carboxy-7-deazaguanine synthase [Clostridium saccharobutylicum]AQS10794.1 7-carboxy-7-deazaguanine synthase [Clostridium saccharobutylicum]AQS15041.1 7-carboxy-7-deazaguanine synthase [Clostridium saccharobutylicum]